MTVYTVQTPTHNGVQASLVAPSGTTGDSAPIAQGNFLLVVNGGTATSITLTPQTFDGLTVTGRVVTINANSTYVIPLPRSVYGPGGVPANVNVTYANITSLTGGSTGVTVFNVPTAG